MDYQQFLNKVIDDGIDAATKDYGPGRKLDGSVAGFLACRGKTPEQLVELLGEARKKAQVLFGSDEHDEYWYLRCYELEVEWVINCVSAIIMNQGGQPLLSHLPTARGVMKAAEVVGVASTN